MRYSGERISILLFTFLMITGCVSQAPDGITVQQTVNPPQQSSLPKEKPNQIPKPPRAIGVSRHGELRIVPITEEQMEKVEAPSCMGKEGDYWFRSDYNVEFDNQSGQTTILEEHAFSQILSSSTGQIQLNHLQLGDIEFFYLVPEQNYCHGEEVFFYGVDAGGKAFCYQFDPKGATLLPGVAPFVKEGKLYIPTEANAGAEQGYQDIRSYNYIYSPDNSMHTIKLEKKELIDYLKENQSVEQSMEVDLDGDGQKSKLVITVQMDANSNLLTWIIIENDEEKIQLTPADEGLFGPRAEMKLDDIDGFGKPMVLVFRRSTGTGGATGLTVVNPSGDWNKLLDLKTETDLGSSMVPNSTRYEMKYVGDYKVSFKDNKVGITATIALDPMRYESMDANKIDQWLQGIRTWVDPISDYEIRDSDGDGIKEIIAIQRVIGVSHPDTIDLLKTTYKLRQGKFHEYSEEMYSSDGKLIKSVEIS
jgi:ribosomal protein L25 (general stress protein Ctc)